MLGVMIAIIFGSWIVAISAILPSYRAAEIQAELKAQTTARSFISRSMTFEIVVTLGLATLMSSVLAYVIIRAA